MINFSISNHNLFTIKNKDKSFKSRLTITIRSDAIWHINLENPGIQPDTQDNIYIYSGGFLCRRLVPGFRQQVQWFGASMASVISTISTSETELILSTYIVTPTSTGGPVRQQISITACSLVAKPNHLSDVPMACPPPPAPNYRESSIDGIAPILYYSSLLPFSSNI